MNPINQFPKTPKQTVLSNAAPQMAEYTKQDPRSSVVDSYDAAVPAFDNFEKQRFALRKKVGQFLLDNALANRGLSTWQSLSTALPFSGKAVGRRCDMDLNNTGNALTRLTPSLWSALGLTRKSIQLSDSLRARNIVDNQGRVSRGFDKPVTKDELDRALAGLLLTQEERAKIYDTIQVLKAFFDCSQPKVLAALEIQNTWSGYDLHRKKTTTMERSYTWAESVAVFKYLAVIPYEIASGKDYFEHEWVEKERVEAEILARLKG